MKKGKILLLICLFFCVQGNCQSGFASLQSKDRISPNMCSLKACKILDSTQLVARYEFKFLPDTTKNTFIRDVLILQIGANISKCFGLKMYLDDMVYTELMCGDRPAVAGARYNYKPTKEETIEYQDAGDKVVDYEIISDQTAGKLVVIHHGHNGFDRKIRYEEALPILTWVLTGRNKEILGYACIEATCLFRGRKWIVWFATDIPVIAGPWKLRGLPGLILEASDANKHFMFNCIQLNQKREAICLYDVPTTTVTREKYIQYEKRMYEAPADILGNGGEWKIYYNGQLLGADWTIPYNPIELE